MERGKPKDLGWNSSQSRVENQQTQPTCDAESRFTSIAVITVEPAGKASFALGCIQTRLMGQYNGK